MGGCGRSLVRADVEAAQEEVRHPDDLVGDSDRRARVDLVERAYAEGVLGVDELEGALEAVLRAHTWGQLEAATSVLPERWVAGVRRAEVAAQRRSAARGARRREVETYVAVIGLLVGIWLLTAVTAGATYFWPMWPALGWGIPLLLRGRHHGPDADRSAPGVP